MDVVKIVITVEVPDGCRATVATETPGAAKAEGQADTPAEAANPPGVGAPGGLGVSCEAEVSREPAETAVAGRQRPSPALGADSCQNRAEAGQQTASGPLVNPGALEDLGAYATLVDMGVDHPDRVLQTYAAGRVLDVCAGCEKAGERVKNKPAWIMASLRKGWTV